MTPPRSAATVSGLSQLFAGARLTPAQRSVAHYILDHPDEIGLLSSPALAERVGVSQPSVARFVAAVGFDSYAAFQTRIRQLHTKSLVPAVRESNLYERAVRGAVARLDAPANEMADASALEDMGAALASSPVLPIVGLRTAAGAATAFASFACKIHPDVRLFTEGGSGMFEGLLGAHSAGADWALGIVLPRYPGEAIEALDYLKQQGCKVAVITDNPLSPAARLADMTVVAAIGSDLIFDTQVVPTMVANLLLEAIADATPKQTQQRLEAFDDLADARGLFVE
ncbi:MAG: MurR/RpiR family transcriptional regulator [Acidimicrobiales bacterium]